MEAHAPVDEFSDQLPEALAPYAAALAAEGFEVAHTERSVRGTWEPVPEVYYFCTVAMHRGNIITMMHRMRPGVWPFRLFLWTRLTTPDELHWLLQRSMEWQEARANPAAEAAVRGLSRTSHDDAVPHLPRQTGFYRPLKESPDVRAALE
jgi:hypothetical protein